MVNSTGTSSVFDFVDDRCFTVSAFMKTIKARDLIKLIRLAFKKASQYSCQETKPVDVMLVADKSGTGKAQSYHVAFSRNLTEQEKSCLEFQMKRKCEAIDTICSKNRYRYGIHNAAQYLLHDGHSMYVHKKIK